MPKIRGSNDMRLDIREVIPKAACFWILRGEHRRPSGFNFKKSKKQATLVSGGLGFQAAEVFVGMKPCRVSVRPAGLDGVAADCLPGGEVEAAVVVGDGG